MDVKAIIDRDIELGGDIDHVCEIFELGFKRCIDAHVPEETDRQRKTHESVWFNGEAEKLVSNRHRLFNKYRGTGCTILRRQSKYFLRGTKRST